MTRKIYDPCIGGRISSELMARVNELDMTHTELLRKALAFYLDFLDNKDTYVVNKGLIDDGYEEIRKEIDKRLEGL